MGIASKQDKSRLPGDLAVNTVLVLAGLDAGGTEKIVNWLARHRLSVGDRVAVVAVNAVTPASFFAYPDDIAIYALDSQNCPRCLRNFMRLWRLRQMLSSLQPDVTLSFLTKINVMTAIATTGLRTCLVLSERNNFLVQKMHPLWQILLHRLARGTRLVMQTEQARLALPEALRARSVVIPNPVEAPSNAWDPPAWHPNFVAAGRLDRQKGFDILVDAFAGVLARLPSASLTIFGEGPERSALERQVRKLGIQERVALPGQAASPDDWMAAGSIFVLSSRFEGFPNVLVEALARGAPVVAFDCPWGPAEILRGTSGYPLVPVGDKEALAEALLHVAEDAALRRRLAEAGPAIAEKYSSAAVSAEWDALIENVLMERPARVADRGICSA